MLALLGFLTIGGFLALVLIARAPVIVALILTPIVAALLGGFAGELGPMAVDGLKAVAPICTLLVFAILYFGLMIDVGLFEPLVRGLAGLVRADPVRLCLVTALLTLLVALDGDGATTFLISINALLPLHRRMGMNPLVLPCIVGLSAGVMNMLPWGGPTARAVAALGAEISDVFVPVVPAMLAGIGWVFCAAWLIGRGEKKRLAAAGLLSMSPPGEAELTPARESIRVDRLFVFNAALTAILIALLFTGWMPLPLLFMVAFAIALPFNRRTWEAQKQQLASHAPSVVLGASMILAAGVFTGILNGTGMIKAMALVLASSTPDLLTPYLSHIVAITSMPLSLIFTPDAYYYGMLPIFAETADAVGEDPLAIGRAAILGHMTTGFPLSPLAAPTFILIGLSQVSLREHQRFMFKWAFGTTVAMTIIAGMTNAL